jgi:hypothetical protein
MSRSMSSGFQGITASGTERRNMSRMDSGKGPITNHLTIMAGTETATMASITKRVGRKDTATTVDNRFGHGEVPARAGLQEIRNA